MLSVSRTLALALTLTMAVAVAGCGGDDEKSPSTATAPAAPTTVATAPASPATNGLAAQAFTSLNQAAKQVVDDLSDIGKATTACSKASSSASEVGGCVSARLDKATTKLTALAAKVRGVSADVSGPCQSSLQTFAGDIDDLGAGFATASKALLAGDGAAATTALKGLRLDAIQASGGAAQNACKP